MKKRKTTELIVLEAFHGDCLLVKTFNKAYEEKVILIDGGTANTFKFSLKKELQHIKVIDLLILTHVDSDHIAGLIRFYKNSLIKNIEVKEIWVNTPEFIDIEKGGKISYQQGNVFLDLIKEKTPNAIIKTQITSDLEVKEYCWGDITILSPNKKTLDDLKKKWLDDNKSEEKSNISNSHEQVDKNSLRTLSKEKFSPQKSIKDDIVNSSSIAFIIDFSDKKILFLADSRPEIILKKLTNLGYSVNKKLKVDFVKVSHHGSKNNTSNELLDIIDCNNFIISTNGGNNSRHPSRETIARIIYHQERNLDTKRNIFFNYKIESIKNKAGDFISSEDLLQGNWEIIDTKKSF